MDSKGIIRKVLGHLKEGKILGTVKPSHEANLSSIKTSDSVENNALKYRSYNPSLTKEDFCSLDLGAVFMSKRPSGENFELIKCRDPKFFQFQDQYLLLFKDQSSRQKYLQSSSLGRINNVRVKFYPVRSGARLSYSNYVQNLVAAYDSSRTYFDLMRAKNSGGMSAQKLDLNALQCIADPLEKKSALLWNLPLETKPVHVMDRFWFYDLKHCFKLYWDDTTGQTLYYMAFNESEDCEKFQRNLHGTYLNDLSQKLLVQRLG
ncbi:BN860_15104g1_1 [Zygosaccharomyces bailii CLIB 213]|uniref:BN860_15104g1_1 n=1 Tax=Zygosaccharomyces bailii (strain CLIB 213 / ATCC 58445 / CBS 680 / BCRC 21525 / NBRC 1098 / NCYC 1416 / NRRL Y-2227) TaxID=1333698 RepID=A0A8J2T4G6_ZYGB2|nr:BN860_15104g1_1 [Zygosaccharomyces bailii CLIB 213]